MDVVVAEMILVGDTDCRMWCLGDQAACCDYWRDELSFEELFTEL